MATEHLYGFHAVAEVLQEQRRRVWKMLLGSYRRGAEVERLVALAGQHNIPIETVDRASLDRLLGHGAHQGIVVLVEPLAYQDLDSLLDSVATAPGKHAVVVLDGITDVGNFAALIRSSVAFGVEALLIPRHHSVSLNPAVAKRSAGALEHLPVIQVVNIVRSLEALKEHGFWVYGAEAQGDVAVARLEWPERFVLVLGAEGRGLRRLVRENCDALLRIPMRPGVDSLNVATAGAIILAYSWNARTPS